MIPGIYARLDPLRIFLLNGGWEILSYEQVLCVLHIKPFFLLVDIRHTQCPPCFFILERYKRCGHKTTTQAATLYQVDSSGTMPCHNITYASYPDYWSLSCDHGLRCSDELMWQQQQHTEREKKGRQRNAKSKIRMKAKWTKAGHLWDGSRFEGIICTW